MNDNFNATLCVGKKVEKYVANYFISRGNTVEDLSDIPQWRAVDTDLRITSKTGNTATFEVKSDTKIHKNGNFFFEIGFERATGFYEGWLDKCKADYLCFVDGIAGKAYVLDFDKCKADMVKCGTVKRFYNKVDNCYGLAYLVPICMARKYNWIVYEWNTEGYHYE